ncbi:hypothetical protein D7Z54_02235 [Salibacterium salarium]|uniref:Uncharacterized protein n=1 Tax=Salibacterium salarium TaxID=284579 RepID=A0A428NAJ3_9BACI|nr:hypothetical protein [Salibacterium salarium]RSL35403.1 hypothetical protein D7Z54_02235 [Salibacterium salarium]
MGKERQQYSEAFKKETVRYVEQHQQQKSVTDIFKQGRAILQQPKFLRFYLSEIVGVPRFLLVLAEQKSAHPSILPVRSK